MLRLLAGISLVVMNRALMRLGLRPPTDGWRHGAGLALRGETARFFLSAFSLDVFSDEPTSAEPIGHHLARRLEAFLQSESEFAVLIHHHADQDVLVGQESPSYTLGLQPWVEGPARFIRPDSWVGQLGQTIAPGTSPVFEFIARVNADRRADLWLRINHVAADGVPAQEMLSRLESTWGAGPLVLPSADEFEPLTRPRQSPGRAGTVEVQALIDFAPLLSWRKTQNATLTQSMTVSAAILWWLAKHEAFAGLHFGTTVEMPASNGINRGVGVVVVRPADYFNRPKGLADYVAAFNRQLEQVRTRTSSNCRTLDAAAYLAPRMEKTLLYHALNEGKGAFGSVGLTILKDAKVFGAPLGDAGHVNGFIAIGAMSLSTADGERVGCVHVKGPAGRIDDYADVIREAICAAS